MSGSQNYGNPPSIYEVSDMVAKAYPLRFIPKNIVSGLAPWMKISLGLVHFYL